MIKNLKVGAKPSFHKSMVKKVNTKLKVELNFQGKIFILFFA